jgi:hypothetical protein
MFGIQEIKKNIFTIYIGKFIEQDYKYIAGTKVKCINIVCSIKGKKAKDFIDKFRGIPVCYEKTHSYREEYDDDISMSETDSELEFESD